MLAICSDLDETPDADTYFELMRFLNTTTETAMGPGVGLDVGNSIYFDMAAGHFSYWNTTEENREKICALIRSGHVDVLHSYGDLATTRAHAVRALEELERRDCHLKVWVDHAQAPTNFGSDIMMGHGDEPAHPAYHADLTLAHGIQYVWRGRVTSVIGQDQRFRLRHLISDLCPPSSVHSPRSSVLRRQRTEDRGQKTERYRLNIDPPSPMLCSLTSDRRTLTSGLLSVLRPRSSGFPTLLKECAKQLLARCGSRKYRLHAANRTLQPATLRDGSRTFEFLRCNPHWGGVSCGDRGDRIHEVLTPHFLDRLVERESASILYTHLGKLDRGEDRRRFSPAVVAAFRLLAEYYRSGKILVTTTRRLLDYQRLWSQVESSTSRNATNENGRQSISTGFPRLEFPL